MHVEIAGVFLQHLRQRLALFHTDGAHQNGLADEPTGNLDSKTSAEVLGLIKRTSAEFHQTVVMITHNSEIAQLADRIVRIEDGKIVR